MTTLNIRKEEFPELTGQVALITGGSSGIGLATAHLLSKLGATVHTIDRNPPPSSTLTALTGNVTHHPCDITSWSTLLSIFTAIGHVDIVVANAGVSQETDYFADSFSSEGELLEPAYGVLDVNLHATLNVIKLTLRAFRTQWNSSANHARGGSLVLTSSATAYAPELSLPVYSASKLAQIGLLRALRPVLPLPLYHNSTINAVAPAATITALLPADLAAPIIAAGLPVSSADHVALAIVHAATATQTRQVEDYGKDDTTKVKAEGRWNGRCTLTLGDKWVELEEGIARGRAEAWQGGWMGGWVDEMTRFQQAATDTRVFERN